MKRGSSHTADTVRLARFSGRRGGRRWLFDKSRGGRRWLFDKSRGIILARRDEVRY
jgi:hypothetical protein